jgi:hypothetical protein
MVLMLRKSAHFVLSRAHLNTHLLTCGVDLTDSRLFLLARLRLDSFFQWHKSTKSLTDWQLTRAAKSMSREFAAAMAAKKKEQLLKFGKSNETTVAVQKSPSRGTSICIRRSQ